MRWVFVLMLFLPAMARGEIVASLALPDAVRPNGWQTIAFTGITQTGGTITVRDARGGVAVSRPLPLAAGQTVLVPLPLIAPVQLPTDAWPVDVTIASADHVELVHQRMTVSLSPAGAAGAFRVAAPDRLPENIPWEQLSGQPVSVLHVSNDDLLHAPPVTFACCDAIIIPADLAGQITEDRALALAYAGPQLVALTTDAPAGGLARFVWEHRPGFVWVCPVQRLPGLQILEPGLGHLPILAPAADAGPLTRSTLLVIGPAALVVLLLVRVFVSRRIVVLVSGMVALAGVAAIAIAVLRANAPDTVRTAAWQTVFAAGEGAAPSDARSGPILTEALTTLTPFFAKHLQITAPMLMPIAPDARGYFAMPNARISLNEIGQMTLEMDIPAGQTVAWIDRRATLGSLIRPLSHSDFRPHFLQDAGITTAWWIDSGHIEGRSVEQFAATHPEMELSLRAWYELRFTARDTWLLEPPTATRPLRLIDFTNLTPDDSPPTSILPSAPAATRPATPQDATRGDHNP